VDNQLAFDYLQTLASLIKENKLATMAATTFLTPYVVSQLPERSALKLLNSNQEQAYLVWDNSCRQELLDKMDETRDFLVKNEYKLDIDKFGIPTDFRYSAHKHELIIGEIFVRVYNLQPTTILKDPKKFCLDLLDFLGSSSQYINTLMAMQFQQEQVSSIMKQTILTKYFSSRVIKNLLNLFISKNKNIFLKHLKL
jgi:DnaJ family protein C protein 13